MSLAQQATKVTTPLASALPPPATTTPPAIQYQPRVTLSEADREMARAWGVPDEGVLLPGQAPGMIAVTSGNSYGFNYATFDIAWHNSKMTEFAGNSDWHMVNRDNAELRADDLKYVAYTVPGETTPRQVLSGMVPSLDAFYAGRINQDQLEAEAVRLTPTQYLGEPSLVGAIFKAAVTAVIAWGVGQGVSSLLSAGLEVASGASGGGLVGSGAAYTTAAGEGIAGTGFTLSDLVRAGQSIYNDVRDFDADPNLDPYHPPTTEDYLGGFDPDVLSEPVTGPDGMVIDDPVYSSDGKLRWWLERNQDGTITDGAGIERNQDTNPNTYWWEQLEYERGPQGLLDAREDGWRMDSETSNVTWDQNNIYGDGLARSMLTRDPITGEVTDPRRGGRSGELGNLGLPLDLIIGAGGAAWRIAKDWAQGRDHISVFQGDRTPTAEEPPDRPAPILGPAPRVDDAGEVVDEDEEPTALQPPSVYEPQLGEAPRVGEEEPERRGGSVFINRSTTPLARAGEEEVTRRDPPTIIPPQLGEPPRLGVGEDPEPERRDPPVIIAPQLGDAPRTPEPDPWEEWQRERERDAERRRANIGGTVGLGTAGNQLHYREGYAGFTGGEAGRSVFTGPGRYNNPRNQPNTVRTSHDPIILSTPLASSTGGLLNRTRGG